MSIKRSLQNSILLISVIPVLLMAVLAYLAASTKYGQITETNSANIAKDYGYGFSSQLESQFIESGALASTNDIKTLLVEKINSPDILLNSTSSCYNKVKESLTQVSNSFGNQVQYYIYDIDGYLVAASGDCTLDWAEVMMNPVESYHETTVISSSGFTSNTIDVVSPVWVKNQIVGLVRSNISIEYFEAFLSKEINSFIIDEKGNPLLGRDFRSEEDLQFSSHIDDIRKNLLQNAEKGSTTFSNTRKSIYGCALIPEYNWIYVIKLDTTSYTNIVATLPLIFIVIITIVIILAILLSKNLALKYTKPLLTLSDNIQKAADGNLEVHCTTESSDEFGLLSTNFNHMMDIISANYNEISDAKQALQSSQLELQNNYQYMERLAYTDALTGLYNRMAFFKYAPGILAGDNRSIKTHAVIFIDLDGFKGINDTLGHDYGDLLLQSISTKLSNYINDDDILARNGGDEFVILRNRVPSHDDLENFLANLVSIASTPFVLDDETVHITISAGAAIFPQNGLSLNELMKNADIAMYSAKNSGKNSYSFFNSSMEDEVNRKNDLVDILRDAVRNKDIYLLYQPQADVSTGKILGCEALMRLNSPIVGYVSPDEFIPVAEECGLIDELGEWALLEACSFNQRLIDEGFPPQKISVNVSTTQLRGDRLIHAIEELPEKTSMPLQYLEIELTESVLMTNFEHNLTLIRRMKELGIQIALDDFGTGYSSFSYLTKIPIDTLKIDKSFIANICENNNDKYIAGTIINLAHQLGITVVAEGVETIEQLKVLQGQTCDILQGYFFSRAISENDFKELLSINSEQ